MSLTGFSVVDRFIGGLYKENGRDMTEDGFDVSIRSVLNDIRNSKIESGLALSDVPPLFIEEQFIQKVNINQ